MLPIIIPGASNAKAPGISRIVGYRLQQGGNTISDNSSNGYTRNEGRMLNKTGNFDCHSLQLVVGNFYIPTAGAGESVGSISDITFEAALETVSPSAAYRFTFGAQNNILLKTGSIILSDPLGLDLPAYSSLFTRTGFTTASTTLNWPTGTGAVGSGEVFFTSASVSSQILATGALANPSGGNGGLGGFSAMALVGIPVQPMACVGLVTDSIGDGSGDTNTDTNGNYGFLAYALWNSGNIIPWVKLGKGGGTVQEWATASISYRRRYMLRFVNNVIIELGTNDFAVGRTLAQVKADYLTMVTAIRRHAVGTIKIFANTITTKTTNGANTTISAGFEPGGIVDQFNTWLLAGNATNGLGLDGVIDNRASVQNLSTNFWISTSYTADGTHPSHTGHAAMAANTALVIPNLLVS